MPKARTRFPKWSLRCLLAEHTSGQMLASAADDELLGVLHVGLVVVW